MRIIALLAFLLPITCRAQRYDTVKIVYKVEEIKELDRVDSVWTLQLDSIFRTRTDSVPVDTIVGKAPESPESIRPGQLSGYNVGSEKVVLFWKPSQRRSENAYVIYRNKDPVDTVYALKSNRYGTKEIAQDWPFTYYEDNVSRGSYRYQVGILGGQRSNEITVDATGETYTVSGSIKNTLSQIEKGKGHILYIPPGNYTITGNLEIREGINIIGAGSDRVTINSSGGNDYKGALYFPHYYSAPAGRLNAQISGLTIKSAKNVWSGIAIGDKSNFLIKDVIIDHTEEAGIYIYGSDVHNFAILGADVINSSVETTSFSRGNIMIRGNIYDAAIKSVFVDHAEAGYAFKFETHSGEGKITRLQMWDVRTEGKPTAEWSGGLASNISIEFPNAAAESVFIGNSFFDNQLSFPHHSEVNSDYSVKLTGNLVKNKLNQAIEIGMNKMIIADNVFDMRETENPWNWGGEYNAKGTFSNPVADVKILNNQIIGLHGSFIYTKSFLSRWLIEHNEITSGGNLIRIRPNGMVADFTIRDNVLNLTGQVIHDDRGELKPLPVTMTFKNNVTSLTLNKPEGSNIDYVP